MTQFSAAFFFFLALSLWSLDPTKRRAALKSSVLSIAVASPYLVYFLYNFPSFNLVLGNLGFKYFFLKITFSITTLAVLGLRRNWFSASLGASGFILSAVQPTNFCFLSFPMALFSSFFVHDFFICKKSGVIALIFLSWLLFIPSQEYVSKLQPAASDYESFVWLRENSVEGVTASGWYQAPILAYVSRRVPVLGFAFPDEERIDDMRKLYNGDARFLDMYDISYLYFGSYEEYDYNSVALNPDRVYSGKGAFYKREPPLIYVLITIDVEPDLPPVLTSYRGIEEGLPFLMDLLDKYRIPATFFVLGETAQKYPSQIAGLTSHEIGCHSLYHEDLRKLSFEEKERRIEEATLTLRELAGDITSFRAPGHSCDSELISILESEGYSVEASACTQFFYPYHPSQEDWLSQGNSDFLRVPVSHTPSYFCPPLVYPRSWIDVYLDALTIQESYKPKIIVIGLHLWEFMDLKAPGYESYTQACGEYTRTEFSNLLEFLHKRRVAFLTMRQLYGIWEII